MTANAAVGFNIAMDMHPVDPQVTRRRLLGVGAAVVTLSACSSGDGSTAGPSSTDPSSTDPSSTDPSVADPGGSSRDSTAGSGSPDVDLTSADFDGLDTCKLLPEQMAGPFPLDEQFDRRDMTEGVPGRPMRLGLRVVDGACAPVAGAMVELWHCDASGDYSAFVDNGGGKDEGPGTTFLRGTQTAGDDGIVEFQTIVPGWYTGRAVHVHLRVHLEGGIVLTSQMYFDADYLEGVYKDAPYAEFGLPDTSNEADAIASDPTSDGTLLHTTDAETAVGPGTLALLNLGVSA